MLVLLLCTYIGMFASLHSGDMTDPMQTMSIDEPWRKSLKIHHQELRSSAGIIINSFLPELRKLPLTDPEYSQIHDLTSNMEQVDVLIMILLTKTKLHFDQFCSILENNGCEHWATILRKGEATTNRPCLICSYIHNTHIYMQLRDNMVSVQI